MNPWGLLAIAIGIVLIIIGVKGTQHDIAGTIVNRKGQKSTTSPSSSTGTVSMA